MKNNFQILFAVLIGLTACNSNRNDDKKNGTGYTITGSIKGLDSGIVKLVAQNEEDRTTKTLDSVSFKNGTFEIKGTAPAQMVSLTIVPGNWSTQIFLEDTIIKISGDTTGSQYYDYTSYGYGKGASLKNVEESGSKNYYAWMAYQNNPEQKKFMPVFDSLGKKIETAKNKDDEYRFRDQSDSVRKILNKWRENYVSNFIRQNPSLVIGPYMLSNLYEMYSDLPYEDMNKMYSNFSGDAAQSKYYKNLGKSLAMRKAVMPGSIAPDFTLLKRDSTKFTLSSIRGKYVMIDFWASWCYPCRQAIPHWKEVYSKYKDKGFDIVSVSDDSRWSDWFKAMDKEKMPWTQVCDEFPLKNMPARVGSLYMTTYIPFYVLLDQQGKILVYSGDETKIDQKLAEIFKS